MAAACCPPADTPSSTVRFGHPSRPLGTRARRPGPPAHTVCPSPAVPVAALPFVSWAVFIYSAIPVPSRAICLILLGINCKQTLVSGCFLVI